MSTSSGVAIEALTDVNKLRMEPSSIDESVRDAIERATLGKAGNEIAHEAALAEGLNRILTIPWTAPSPYRRREIIQGEGERSSAIGPMRVKARVAFVETLGNAPSVAR
jgi:hypothetical protein